MNKKVLRNILENTEYLAQVHNIICVTLFEEEHIDSSELARIFWPIIEDDMDRFNEFISDEIFWDEFCAEVGLHLHKNMDRMENMFLMIANYFGGRGNEGDKGSFYPD